MADIAFAEKIEEIRKKVSKRASAPDATFVDTYENLFIIMKPFKNPYNLERLLKNPLQFDDINARLSRQKKAILNIQHSKYNVKKLLLKQEFIVCRAKDGTPFIVKITEFRKSVKSMAEIPLREICVNREYVKALANVSSFALCQLILHGRKYDLIGGTKNPLSLNMVRLFISTLKSKNVFTGINPKTGKEDIFTDGDSYINICESKFSVAKAVLNFVLWMRNFIFYYLIFLLHKINIFPDRIEEIGIKD